MTLHKFYQILQQFAPTQLSNDYCQRYGAYDNSGILIDTGKEVKSVLFSLDFSYAAVESAIKMGVNAIVTHHPAIYGAISRLDNNNALDKKVMLCIEHGISVISMHLNLDVAKGGIDESLMQGVRACANGKGTIQPPENVVICDALEDGVGYGRAYDVVKTDMVSLAAAIKLRFGTDRVLTYEHTDKPVTRVASFCGSGADEKSVLFAKNQGAQVFISADFKHHVLLLAKELGVSVIALTHYSAENYGFEKYFEKISSQVNLPCVWHTDKDLL